MVIKYKTTSNPDSTGHEHSHLITDPRSGYTDAAEDGHKHSIEKCGPCWKSRMWIGQKLTKTSFTRGHMHYFEIAALFDKELYPEDK